MHADRDVDAAQCNGQRRVAAAATFDVPHKGDGRAAPWIVLLRGADAFPQRGSTPPPVCMLQIGAYTYTYYLHIGVHVRLASVSVMTDDL